MNTILNSFSASILREMGDMGDAVVSYFVSTLSAWFTSGMREVGDRETRLLYLLSIEVKTLISVSLSPSLSFLLQS